MIALINPQRLRKCNWNNDYFSRNFGQYAFQLNLTDIRKDHNGRVSLKIYQLLISNRITKKTFETIYANVPNSGNMLNEVQDIILELNRTDRV